MGGGGGGVWVQKLFSEYGQEKNALGGGSPTSISVFAFFKDWTLVRNHFEQN